MIVGVSEMQLVRNCPDAIVDVRFVIDQVEGAALPADPVDCEEKDER